MNERKALRKGTLVERVTFNAITKASVLAAMKAPRQIDAPLVDAYMARRALDYLVGFNLSPVLWRKLPGARSAGRVQSVALRLVCEREAEIEAFKTQEYWTIDAKLATAKGEEVQARELMERLLRVASPLGLYAEEYDVDTGYHLGNFPQAFSHLALIEAGGRIIAAERLRELT